MVILKTARELHKSLFLPSQKRFALGWGLSFITAKLIVYGFVCCTEPRNKPARTFHFAILKCAIFVPLFLVLIVCEHQEQKL